jgi:hypothetical protein
MQTKYVFNNKLVFILLTSTLVFAVIGSHDSIPSFQVFDCEKKVTHPSVFVLSVDIAKIILAERGAEVEATYYCYANRCY